MAEEAKRRGKESVEITSNSRFEAHNEQKNEGIRSKEEKREGKKSKELEELYERLFKYYADIEEERKRRLEELGERLSKYYTDIEEERKRRLKELYEKGYASG